jgi:hypothetical protein
VLGAVVACVVFRFSPVDALRGTWRLFWALPGARIELDDGQTALLISVR